MSNNSNIAYPYANALYDVAKTKNMVTDYLVVLERLSKLSQAVEFKNLLCNPKITRTQILDVLNSYLSSDNDFENFIKLLMQNKRLNCLSDISSLFEKMYQDDKKIAKAVIESAFAIGEEEKNQLEIILSKKFDKSILVSVKINSALIGGIKIIIDDVVIDASVRGSLDKIATQLMR
ncbi:MAG: F0F1 ATP synthase subunit delta [Burkholderiales bacterium]|nr:F0F1 ATP synthase subunit delta [Burkholderiales bacterium]